MTLGQSVRLLIGENSHSTSPDYVIAAAKTLSLHISATVENVTTKDTTGNWVVNEVTGVNYDISTSALVNSGETITSDVNGADLSTLEGIYDEGYPTRWKIANMSGDNNRTAGTVICSGNAIISQLTINAQNRQTATYDCQLQNYGEIVVGSGT